jgi:hypothetical protein
VGSGGANRRDDVLLAQYLLKVAASTGLVPQWKVSSAGVRSGSSTMSSPDTPDPGFTGTWNEWDIARLKGVEQFSTKKGVAAVLDSRIDPVPPGRTQGPIHHMQYKIVTLNLMYAKLRPNDFPRMALANDCPKELRQLIIAPGWLGV